MDGYEFKLKKQATTDYFDQTYCQKILNEIKNDKFTDVVLVAENDSKKILAHRNILIASSGYFRAMFNSNWSENEQNEISMKEIDGNTLQAFIDYCYTGRILITSENVWTILKASSILNFVGIEMECALFLDLQLRECPTECLKFYFIADTHSFSALIRQSITIAADLFSFVSKTDMFLEIPFIALEEILKRNEQIDCKEEEIFTAVMKWVKYDETTRKRFIAKILNLIRLTHIDIEFLSENVKPVCKPEICQELLFNVLTTLSTSPKLINQNTNNYVFMTVGRTKDLTHLADRRYLKIGYFCPNSQEWKVLKILNLKLETSIAVSYASSNLHLYILDEVIENSFKVVNLKTFKGSLLPQMNKKRIRFGTAVFLNGHLYILGGLLEETYTCTASVECFNPYTGEWSAVCDMNVPRANVKAMVFKNCIYTAGGYTFDGISTRCEYYDPSTDTWTTIPDFHPLLLLESIYAVHDRLHAIGIVSRNVDANNNNEYGDDDFNHQDRQILVQFFDPEKNVWIKAFNLYSRYQTMAIFTHKNDLYRIGKTKPTSYSYKSVFQKLQNNKWVEVCSCADGFDYIYAVPILSKFLNLNKPN